MSGIVYIEILIAALLAVVVLVPALNAMKPGIDGAAIHQNRLADHYQLAGKLEDVLARSFFDIDTVATAAGGRTNPSSYSDIVSYPDGRQLTRNVFLSRYDTDNADGDDDPFTGIDAGLLWVRVELAGTSDGLETLVSE